MSRLPTVLVNSNNRSASVLLPWSMWAIMQKLRICFTLEYRIVVTTEESYVVNHKNTHKKTNAGLIGEPACSITLHQQTKNRTGESPNHQRGNKAVGGGLEPPTVQLATVQLWWSTPVATRAALCCVYPLSPPPRQEGTSANFDILQCEKKSQEDRRVTPLDQLDNTKIAHRVYLLQILHKIFLKFIICIKM